ncbi:MAG TPA: hypothetical protein VFT26_01355, partial [Pyrinomonadaceae bacterium]|nr:hypothetical protein [Pyrinomonadaceae bacterium]
ATARCLVFRCSPEIASGKHDIYKRLADRMYEGMEFIKRQHEAESKPSPELDEMLANDVRTNASLPQVNDPLERMARRYAHASRAYLVTRRDYPCEIVWRASGPTPVDVFAWFHTLIAVKIYRALAASALVARGTDSRKKDVLCSAKVALIGIDRSLDALAAIACDDVDARVELLQGHLRRLKREVSARFPEARAVVREGLE